MKKFLQRRSFENNMMLVAFAIYAILIIVLIIEQGLAGICKGWLHFGPLGPVASAFWNTYMFVIIPIATLCMGFGEEITKYIEHHKKH